MISDLPPVAIEVLRSLVLGFPLRREGNEWRFIDRWGRPIGEVISCELVAALKDGGYASEESASISITESGANAFMDYFDASARKACKWLMKREVSPS